MNYDFTTVLDRHGMDALAVDGLGRGGSGPRPPREGFDVIPMWVADMSFPTCPTIVDAMARRVAHPLYGYFTPRQAYFDSIIRWQERRHGVTGLTADCIGYENGVLGGVLSALGTMCSRGGKVLVHSPTYIGFTGSLTNAGYHIVHSPLVRDEAGAWRMDLADMEQKLVEHHIHAAILCSPHNPCGRVWERQELEAAMALFEKYGVRVVSDEIWSDIILDGHRHLPTQRVSPWARDNTVALYAPSKTFNLAGLVGSYHIIYDKTLQDRVEAESSLSHYNSMNVLSMHALIGAYQSEGEEWVDQLCQTLSGNVTFALDHIGAHYDGIEAARPQGTYMLFLDCTRWCADHGRTLEQLLQACWDVGVAVQDGRPFHGPCHIRVNLALPLSRVREAFDRLDRYVFQA